MKPNPLPDEIAKIIESFKQLVDEVDPNIAVTGKMQGNVLVMEGTLAAKHQLPGQEGPLENLHKLLTNAQIDGMDPASVTLENPRSPLKKKLIYSLDASDPARAHKHVMEDREIVLSTLLTDRLMAHSKQAIKEGESPEAVKAVLEYSQSKVCGEIAETAQWTPRLLELEKSFASAVMNSIGRGIDISFVPDAFDTAIQYVNQNNIAGVWRGDDEKGQGRLH